MAVFLLFLALLGMSVTDVMAQTCSFNRYVQNRGCTMPDILSWKHSMMFRHICNKQLLCHTCGGEYNVDSTNCDINLMGEMARLCFKEQMNNRKECFAAMTSYVMNDFAVGRNRYSASSENWCRNSWVKKCLGITDITGDTGGMEIP